MRLFGLIDIARARKPRPFLERYPTFSVGRGTYGTPEVIGPGLLAKLVIGSFCSISDCVVIVLDAEHRPDWITTYPFNVLIPSLRAVRGHPTTKGDVVIGDDVWIGYGATIMSGVTISTGAVIGCRAVVSRDVPPYAVVTGNPAKIARFRFSEDIVTRLLQSRWWELPDEQIEALGPFLLNDNLPAFFEAVDRMQHRPVSTNARE